MAVQALEQTGRRLQHRSRSTQHPTLQHVKDAGIATAVGLTALDSRCEQINEAHEHLIKAA